METLETKVMGVLGDFKNPDQLIHAAEKIHEHGYTKFDIHTPYPVHGLDKAMGIKKTILPKFSLAGGMFGLASAFALQYWSGAIEYKLNIGGKPLFASQYGMPVFFELTVLCAALTTFFIMFGYLCKLPNWYSPYQHDKGFLEATDDNFCVIIESTDSRFTVETTKRLLEQLGASNVRVVES